MRWPTGAVLLTKTGPARIGSSSACCEIGHTGQRSGATSYYVAQPSDAMIRSGTNSFAIAAIILPSQRRDRVATLAEAVARPGAATAARIAAVRPSADDALLAALMAQLKPREIVSLANGRSRLAPISLVSR